MLTLVYIYLFIYLFIYRLFSILETTASREFCNAGIFTRLASRLNQICQPWYFQSVISKLTLLVTSASYIR
jgi:hypothetical protein